jgi:hypothetical protein
MLDNNIIIQRWLDTFTHNVRYMLLKVYETFLFPLNCNFKWKIRVKAVAVRFYRLNILRLSSQDWCSCYFLVWGTRGPEIIFFTEPSLGCFPTAYPLINHVTSLWAITKRAMLLAVGIGARKASINPYLGKSNSSSRNLRSYTEKYRLIRDVIWPWISYHSVWHFYLDLMRQAYVTVKARRLVIPRFYR